MQKEYHWSEATKGIILGSFFAGYIFTQILGGWLSERLNGKIVIFTGVAMWSSLTLLTPIAASYSSSNGQMPIWLIAVRVAMGIFEGVNGPSIHHVISVRTCCFSLF